MVGLSRVASFYAASMATYGAARQKLKQIWRLPESLVSDSEAWIEVVIQNVKQTPDPQNKIQAVMPAEAGIRNRLGTGSSRGIGAGGTAAGEKF